MGSSIVSMAPACRKVGPGFEFRPSNSDKENGELLLGLLHRVGRVLSVSPVVGIGTPPPL
jgi:hypothetical protein